MRVCFVLLKLVNGPFFPKNNTKQKFLSFTLSACSEQPRLVLISFDDTYTLVHYALLIKVLNSALVKSALGVSRKSSKS